MIYLMKTVDLNPNPESSQKLYTIAIGIFDGLHKGHREILKRLSSFEPSAVLTFYPHPRKDIKLLLSLSERLKDFKELGINRVFIMTGRDKVLLLPAEQFIHEKLKAIGVERVIVGMDFRLGRGRKTDVHDFTTLCNSTGIDVEVIDMIEKNGVKLSSSDIRKNILDGNLKHAKILAEKHFTLSGIVCRGSGIGQNLGFRTANINARSDQVFPAKGVYRTITKIDDKYYDSLTYAGTNPTMKNNRDYILETYIPNFNQTLYGQKIKIAFLDKIREEKHFSSQKELREAISEDINSSGSGYT